MGPRTVTVTEGNFEVEVLHSKQPVLVEFWTPWSRACQILDNVLHELAANWAGLIKVVKVNADDNLDLSLVYNIECIPTLLYFKDGTPQARVVGTASKEAILSKIKPINTPL